MYFKWLQAFHIVAREGGFTAAAKVLNVGQPTVSTHVKSLEDRFAVELFLRRGKRVELTALGQSLYRITQGLYGHEEEAINFLQAARDFQAGQLNVSAIGPHDVMVLLQSFQGLHPNVRLTVSLGDRQEVRQSLLEFRADIAVLAHEEDDPRFSSRFLDRHRIQVMVHVDHPWAKRRSIRFADLEGQRMVMRTSGSTTREAFDSACARAGVNIETAMEIDSREAVREAVIRGLGISVVSETEFAPHERLRSIVIRDAEIYVNAYVTCLLERRDRPLVAAFLSITDELIGAKRRSPRH